MNAYLVKWSIKIWRYHFAYYFHICTNTMKVTIRETSFLDEQAHITSEINFNWKPPIFETLTKRFGTHATVEPKINSGLSRIIEFIQWFVISALNEETSEIGMNNISIKGYDSLGRNISNTYSKIHISLEKNIWIFLNR